MGKILRPVKLSTSEFEERSKELGNKLTERDSLIEKKKAAGATIGAAIKELDVAIRELQRTVRTGAEAEVEQLENATAPEEPAERRKSRKAKASS